jgi:hypothetical protein
MSGWRVLRWKSIAVVLPRVARSVLEQYAQITFLEVR